METNKTIPGFSGGYSKETRISELLPAIQKKQQNKYAYMLFMIWAVMFAMIIFTSACSDKVTGPSDEEITGTWLATKIELTSRANPALKIDLVEHGASGTMIFESDGNWSVSVVDIPGEGDILIIGTWLSEGDVMTIKYNMFGFDSTWQFDMTLSGDILTLAGAHVDFDLTGDDQDEPALITFVLKRQ